MKKKHELKNIACKIIKLVDDDNVDDDNVKVEYMGTYITVWFYVDENLKSFDFFNYETLDELSETYKALATELFKNKTKSKKKDIKNHKEK